MYYNICWSGYFLNQEAVSKRVRGSHSSTKNECIGSRRGGAMQYDFVLYIYITHTNFSPQTPAKSRNFLEFGIFFSTRSKPLLFISGRTIQKSKLWFMQYAFKDKSEFYENHSLFPMPVHFNSVWNFFLVCTFVLAHVLHCLFSSFYGNVNIVRCCNLTYITYIHIHTQTYINILSRKMADE